MAERYTGELSPQDEEATRKFFLEFGDYPEPPTYGKSMRASMVTNYAAVIEGPGEVIEIPLEPGIPAEPADSTAENGPELH